MPVPFEKRWTPLGIAVLLGAVAVAYAHRGSSPPTCLPPADSTVESLRRDAFRFLRIPEPIEIGPPALAGLRFARIPGPSPSAKGVATRDPSVARRDPFFPDWYDSPLPVSNEPILGAAPAAPVLPGSARTAALAPRGATKAGAKVPVADQCQFAGTLLVQGGRPAAVVKDLATGQSVLLTEGESFRGVLLVQLDFFSATFAAPGGSIYRFGAVVGGEKTFPAGDGALAQREGEAGGVGAGKAGEEEAREVPGGGETRRGSDRTPP
jgi:hypothetical protein